jgi:hypothetical protein
MANSTDSRAYFRTSQNSCGSEATGDLFPLSNGSKAGFGGDDLG